MRALKNEAGVGIIMVLILTGIIAMLISFFAAKMYNRTKDQARTESRTNYSELKNYVITSVSKPDMVTRTEELQYQVLPSPTP